jgi:hypothetical protein
MRSALLRMALVLATSIALVVGAGFAPLGLRRIDAFAVQTVEVTGLHYLDAAAAVAAGGITASSNIYDDPSLWTEALLRHPLVREVTISRRVPGTLRLNITESQPVAFARTPELRAMDERGFVLPADPAADGLDLPVILADTRVSGEGRAADEHTRRVAAFIGAVGRLEPGLLGWVSEVGVHGEAIRLVLRNATDAEVLVPADAGGERLRELHMTLAELARPHFAAGSDTTGAATARSAEPELARVKRIDGRFHDQIVVALHRGKN